MEEILRKIKNAIWLLYQNNEQRGMEEVQELLECFQKMLEHDLLEQDIQTKLMGIALMRELLEAYQKHDMMEMADCLEERATDFVKGCFGEK